MTFYEQQQIQAHLLRINLNYAIRNLFVSLILLAASYCINLIFLILSNYNIEIIIWPGIDLGLALSSIVFFVGILFLFVSIRKLVGIFQSVKNNLLDITRKIIIGYILLNLLDNILLIFLTGVSQEIIDYLILVLWIISDIIFVSIFILLSIFFGKSRNITGMNSRWLILPFVITPFILMRFLVEIILFIKETTLIGNVMFGTNIAVFVLFVFICLEIIFCISKINKEQILLTLYPYLMQKNEDFVVQKE